MKQMFNFKVIHEDGTEQVGRLLFNTEAYKQYVEITNTEHRMSTLEITRFPTPAVEGATVSELLKALEELFEISGEANIPLVNSHAVRKMGKFLAVRDKAKAAIRKAKGESQ